MYLALSVYSTISWDGKISKCSMLWLSLRVPFRNYLFFLLSVAWLSNYLYLSFWHFFLCSHLSRLTYGFQLPNGSTKRISLSTTSELSKKIEGKAEAEITPKRLSIKKAELALTEKVEIYNEQIMPHFRRGQPLAQTSMETRRCYRRLTKRRSRLLPALQPRTTSSK